MSSYHESEIGFSEEQVRLIDQDIADLQAQIKQLRKDRSAQLKRIADLKETVEYLANRQ